MMNTNFQLFNHDTGIARYVHSMWQLEGFPPYHQETILPKGIVELIFSFADEIYFHKQDDLKTFTTPRCFVNGMTTVPLCLEAPARQFFFGVELYPLPLKKLLNIPAGIFLNSVTDLALINSEFDTLWHKLGEAADFPQRVELVRDWIVKKQFTLYNQELSFSNFLGKTMPPSSVANLAQEFCYSVRQLNRKSHDLFGMSPLTLIGYKRYIQSLALLHDNHRSLTDIGYQSGYYDQAHFIHDFKEYTGITPGDYRKQKSHMPAHLFH
jgi:AraC-like DNA-binding protein